MCGNHASVETTDSDNLGSPPRVREPQHLAKVILWNLGITPACAGTTLSEEPPPLDRQDHPRVCGNHVRRARSKDRRVGSPPRVREPRLTAHSLRHTAGITPACAGTTRRHERGQSSRWDHPRVCGNHSPVHRQASSVWGSPPRVREPPSSASIPVGEAGITPACAGTTRRRQHRRG